MMLTKYIWKIGWLTILECIER